MFVVSLNELDMLVISSGDRLVLMKLSVVISLIVVVCVGVGMMLCIVV